MQNLPCVVRGLAETGNMLWPVREIDVGLLESHAVAKSLVWFTCPENRPITGQVIFIDGGAEVLLRGEAVY